MRTVSAVASKNVQTLRHQHDLFCHSLAHYEGGSRLNLLAGSFIFASRLLMFLLMRNEQAGILQCHHGKLLTIKNQVLLRPFRMSAVFDGIHPADDPFCPSSWPSLPREGDPCQSPSPSYISISLFLVFKRRELSFLPCFPCLSFTRCEPIKLQN